ncbi:MAG: VTC domain-containing protein [Thermodesulfobacteriota bacterium]
MVNRSNITAIPDAKTSAGKNEGLSDKNSSTAKSIFEVKFAVPREETALLVATLRHNTAKPERFSHAKIKTLYFDDRRGTSFAESLDGEMLKKKYRLRVYIDRTEGAYYSLEIKKRINTITSKVRELIYEQLPVGYRITCFHSLLRTFEEVTGRPLLSLLSELPSKELLLDTVVYYDRIRFDDRHAPVRYNVDTSVRVFPGHSAFGETGAGLNLGHSIFEIKSDKPGVIPFFLKGLSLEPFSFSKFAWGKDFLL